MAKGPSRSADPLRVKGHPVWFSRKCMQTRDFKSLYFGCAATKGLTDASFGCAATKELSGAKQDGRAWRAIFTKHDSTVFTRFQLKSEVPGLWKTPGCHFGTGTNREGASPGLVSRPGPLLSRARDWRSRKQREQFFLCNFLPHLVDLDHGIEKVFFLSL